MTKWKSDFEKWDLRYSGYPGITAIRFVGLLPWCGIVARPEAFIFSYSDLVWDFLELGMWSLAVEYRLSDRKVLDWIHAKVGDKNSCILGGLFTIEVEMGMTN